MSAIQERHGFKDVDETVFPLAMADSTSNMAKICRGKTFRCG
jgi:hypothetical protein